jgi:hypothetical protein
MNPDQSARGLRVDAALAGLTATFHGMTARPDEANCECHWGDAEELALLKMPDVELDSDLLHRTWAATDWRDHASVLRRILPQLATALVSGRVEPWIGLDQVGQSFARGAWQHWPAEQTKAVQEFLEAWWTHSLIESQPTVPAYEVFEFCAVASDDLSVWLNIWQAATHPAADQHMAEAVARWATDLRDDELPWDTHESYEREQAVRADLAAWLVRTAPARLRNHGCPTELLHQVRLLGISIPARWDDPHWPTGDR